MAGRSPPGGRQPIQHAPRPQLVAFIADFKPEASIRDEILQLLAHGDATDTADTRKRRTALEEPLGRMRDLYEFGDLSRPDYLARRGSSSNASGSMTAASSPCNPRRRSRPSSSNTPEKPL